MKVLSILAAGLFLISCANTRETTPIVEEQDGNKPGRNITLKATIGEFKKSDAFEVTRVKLEGNTLYLMVAYSGGCSDHTFEMIGSMAMMKSLPPKRSIQLVHDAHDDTCREWIEKTLEIDISELAPKQEHGSTVVLILDGYDQELTYTFE